MIDVVLYGFDALGFLILEERLFENLGELADHFFSEEGSRWSWAEVEIFSESGELRILRYSADRLRGVILAPNLITSPNETGLLDWTVRLKRKCV